MPLKKIKILDLTTLLPGPYATMILATLGARVLKVENPVSGDPIRAIAPDVFRYLNAQKELLGLDLKKRQGREIFLGLAAGCDVVIEGFRPGVAARLGVDFESVQQANPSIIYCSLSGYGQEGPYTNLPGHDVNYMGVAGLLSVSGEPSSGKPEYPYGAQYADLMGSMFCVNSVLASLVGREPAGKARFLDISLAESTAMLMMPRYLEFLSRGCPAKEELMARGPYGVFETSDHKFLTLGIVEDHFWDKFTKAVERPDLADDPRFKGWVARNSQGQRLRPILEEIFLQKDRRTWLELLNEADVPVGPVHDLNEMSGDPQFLARGFFKPCRDTAELMSRAPRFPVPGLGENSGNSCEELSIGRDTTKWLATLGLEPEEINSMREQRII